MKFSILALLFASPFAFADQNSYSLKMETVSPQKPVTKASVNLSPSGEPASIFNTTADGEYFAQFDLTELQNEGAGAVLRVLSGKVPSSKTGSHIQYIEFPVQGGVITNQIVVLDQKTRKKELYSVKFTLTKNKAELK